jgi:hypothetical protein
VDAYAMLHFYTIIPHHFAHSGQKNGQAIKRLTI